MQTTRDSSVWRSLAVAFGDGLAFGVGMQLTKAAAKQPAQSLPDLHHLERTPATGPGAQLPALDENVFQTAVAALDARLNEHAGLVERRLAELEARLTLELKSVHQRVNSIALGAEARISEVESHVNSQLQAVRQFAKEELGALQNQTAVFHQELSGAVTRQVEEQVASQVERRLPAVEHAIENRLVQTVYAQIGMRVPAEVDARMESVEVRVQQEVREAARQAATVIGRATEQVIEDRISPLRSELREKDRVIGELRSRTVESEKNVLDLILAIGKTCCDAAERLGTGERAAGPPTEPPPSKTPEPEAAPLAASATEPAPPAATANLEAAEAPPVEAAAALEVPAGAEPADPETPALPAEPAHAALIEFAPPGPLEPGTEARLQHSPEANDVPGFARPRKPERLWRIPLVSSFLMCAGLLALQFVR